MEFNSLRWCDKLQDYVEWCWHKGCSKMRARHAPAFSLGALRQFKLELLHDVPVYEEKP